MKKISLFLALLIIPFLATCATPTVDTTTSIPVILPTKTQASTPTSMPTVMQTSIPRFTPTKIHTLRPTSTVTACIQRAHFSDPADSLYVLPYPAGKRYKVGQGYCRPSGTHSNQLAYDFDMGFGDDVTAARSGQVVGLDDHFADDGTASGAQEFNYVFILHEDGTVAFYAHLKQKSVLVQIGDQVEAGQVIAQVGFSGMPPFTVPCLHLGVYTTWPPVEGDDVAINFRNAEGTLDSSNGLYNGSWYEALSFTP